MALSWQIGSALIRFELVTHFHGFFAFWLLTITSSDAPDTIDMVHLS